MRSGEYKILRKEGNSDGRSMVLMSERMVALSLARRHTSPNFEDAIATSAYATRKAGVRTGFEASLFVGMW
jgi:hypothetical protein